MAESGIWFKGKFIRDGEGLYLETSMPFARAGLEGVSRTLKSNMHDAGVCLKEENNFDMAKKYNVISIKLVDTTIPKGSSGGTGYDEYAHLLVEYENGESQEITIGYYCQDTNLVFQQLYDKLYGCENPIHTRELLGEVMYQLIPPAPASKLPDKYKNPKRPNVKPRKIYRIRKLTPKECFRLMGVRDDDIDTILNSGVSNSQQYKMAGNSIVVDVLMGIFKQMLEPDDSTAEILPDEQQLSLFSDIDFC